MLENANPIIKDTTLVPTRAQESASALELLFEQHDQTLASKDLHWVASKHSRREPIDAMEIFDILKPLTDPEHPLPLVQLGVINIEDIRVRDDVAEPFLSFVEIDIAPTIAHCSMATLIGLCVRVRLERCLPSRFRILVRMKSGSHESEDQVNKQLADKERVAAACENQQLMSVLAGMMEGCGKAL